MSALIAATVIGGTSAVAPLWAGLIALLNESLGKPVGFLHPALYANAKAFRDITSGNNGAYAARAGWDACTGLGSPNGTALLSALKGAAESAATIQGRAAASPHTVQALTRSATSNRP